MNRILLASALVLGVSGAAFAQQAPYTIGNFSAAVEQSLNPGKTVEHRAVDIDTMTTASVGSNERDARTSAAPATNGSVSIPLEYGGR